MKIPDYNKKNGDSPATARRIANWCRTRQRIWADILNRSTAHWSAFQKKLALALFLLTMGANSGIILYRSLMGKPTQPAWKPDAIRTISLQADTASGQATAQLQALRERIDSLAATDSGRVLLERLQVTQPRLWDSLNSVLNNHK